MNQEDVRVSFYLKKSEADEQGECPIMGRLNVGKYSEAAFSVKMTAPESAWLSGRATGKSARSREINRQLDEIRASALSIYQDLFALREKVSAEEVKCILLGMAYGQETLVAFFLRFIKKFEKKVGVNRVEGTATSYKYACSHLIQFLNKEYNLSDIPFTALDRSFIDKYDLHLRTDCRLGAGTILLLTTHLMTVIRRAKSAGILTSNPFAGYEAERPAREIKYLTEQELERIMSTPLHNRKLYHIRDLFLFSCFTGLAYADLKRLSEKDIIQKEDGSQWIRIRRKKTDVASYVRLLDIPLRIIEKYKPERRSDKIFNVYCRSYLIKLTKEVGEQYGFYMTFHQARHNFGTHITLSLGIPIETVSRMMGHTSITTTQIYAEVKSRKVDEDTKALREMSAKRPVNLYEEEVIAKPKRKRKTV